MSSQDTIPPPQLAEPLPLLAQPAAVIPAVLIVVGFMFAAFWSLAPGIGPDRAPRQPADLAGGLITPVDPADHAAVSAAVAALRLPPAQRSALEQAVRDGRRRLGWMVFTDSMDPDGDAVAVEAAGIVQHVVLAKAWTPVAVPLDGQPIGVTAVRDGGGGGVTVALATRAGAVALRILRPGERIEVAAP